MKITQVRCHPLAIPLRQDPLPTPWSMGRFGQVLVEVETDEGLVGLGEPFGLGTPLGVTAVIEELLGPMLLGADPGGIAGLQEMMLRRSHLWGRYGLIVSAISGLDMALWDLAAKRAGLPLHLFLGGGGGEPLPVYASLVPYPDLDLLREVASQAAAAGFRAVKIHQTDEAGVRAAREAVGDGVRLMVDVNCPWNPAQAREMARRFKPYDLYWLEEPIWPPEDFPSLASLRRETGMPLALGENVSTVHQFRVLLEAGAADFIQPSVSKVGGVSEWRKVAALAEAFNVGLAPHSFYFGPGLLATAHLIAATPFAGELEHLFGRLEADLWLEPPRLEEGLFHLPEGPGLGLEIDRGVLKEYRLSAG